MSVISTRKRLTTISWTTLVASAVGGLICGPLVLGIGGRLAMRVVAILADQQPSFSIDGTVFILIIGAMFGFILSLPYVLVRGLLPIAGYASGLLYGVAAALLFVVWPVTRAEPTGELALVGPGTAIALFGGLVVAFGTALGAVTDLIVRRQGGESAKRIGIAWPVAILIATIFFFAQAFSVAGEFQPIPQYFSALMRDNGIEFTQMREIHTGIVLLFAIGYWVLSLAVLPAGGAGRTARWSTLSLLLIGGLLFHSGRTPGLAVLGIAPHTMATWLAGVPRLMQALGFGAVVGLLYVTPDGRFRSRRWRAAWLAWCGWFIVWLLPLFPGTALDVMGWPAALRALPVLLAIVSGLAAIGLRYREAAVGERGPVGMALAGYGLMFAALGLIWLAIPTVDGWLAGRAMGVNHFFGFGLYLLPWLLLPGVTLMAQWKRVRQADGQQAAETSSLAAA